MLTVISKTIADNKGVTLLLNYAHQVSIMFDHAPCSWRMKWRKRSLCFLPLPEFLNVASVDFLRRYFNQQAYLLMQRFFLNLHYFLGISCLILIASWLSSFPKPVSWFSPLLSSPDSPNLWYLDTFPWWCKLLLQILEFC